jgi:hypothetical protein
VRRQYGVGVAAALQKFWRIDLDMSLDRGIGNTDDPEEIRRHTAGYRPVDLELNIPQLIVELIQRRCSETLRLAGRILNGLLPSQKTFVGAGGSPGICRAKDPIGDLDRR